MYGVCRASEYNQVWEMNWLSHWIVSEKRQRQDNDVIMGAKACQITSPTIVYSTIHSGADQRKHQSSALLAIVRGINRWPVNSPHEWPVTRKMFPLDNVFMNCEKKPMHALIIFHIYAHMFVICFCYGHIISINCPLPVGRYWNLTNCIICSHSLQIR